MFLTDVIDLVSKGPPSPQKSTSQPNRPQPGRRQERQDTGKHPRHAPAQDPRRAARVPPHGAGGLEGEDTPGPQSQEEPPRPPLPVEPAGRGRTRSVTKQRGCRGWERGQRPLPPLVSAPCRRGGLGRRHAATLQRVPRRRQRPGAGDTRDCPTVPTSLPVGDGEVTSFTCRASVAICPLGEVVSEGLRVLASSGDVVIKESQHSWRSRRWNMKLLICVEGFPSAVQAIEAVQNRKEVFDCLIEDESC
ncbi:E3 ubiquitin-protein ligase MARCHF11-like [Columba livia]|uniref:E3 ubiquitin-protein ligase MARCHF11-like n=1 Tax=Columba livia TaxID=8932 RepID=UPI0031B9E71F